MTLEEVIKYVKEKYDIEPGHLWPKYPNYIVCRNTETKKWFICGMSGLARKLVSAGEEGIIDVIDVKCDPNMIEYLRTQPGLRPGYHMNKKHWLTILLGPLSPKDDEVKTLIDISYKYSCKDWKKLLGLK